MSPGVRIDTWPAADVRPAAVAGSWYPGTAAALAREVDQHLAGRGPGPLADVGAIIAPHAGLMYSGAIAAHAYAAVRTQSFDAVVLVGPSHTVGFDGVALDDRQVFATPLGSLRLAESLADALLAATPVISVYRGAHDREHSLEMQFPFLRHLLPETPIVPLVMGYQTRETIDALASALAEPLDSARTLLIASTDLAHAVDAERARRLAEPLERAVRAFDVGMWRREMERYPESDCGRYVACGAGPAAAVMAAARRRGATVGTVLAYGDSSAVSGDRRSVVGYLAAAFGRPDTPNANAAGCA